MASEDLQRVDNWDDITPPEGETEERRADHRGDDRDGPARAHRDRTPRPTPSTTTSASGPGRTTVLPRARQRQRSRRRRADDACARRRSVGRRGPVDQQRRARCRSRCPRTRTGTTSFSYEVDDGRGGTDTAKVSLSVHGWDVNAAPTQKRVTTRRRRGRRHRHLQRAARLDRPRRRRRLPQRRRAGRGRRGRLHVGRAHHLSGGRRHPGPQGRRDHRLGRLQDVTVGTVRFDVRPVGSTDPVTNADHVAVRTGQTATVAPLDERRRRGPRAAAPGACRRGERRRRSSPTSPARPSRSAPRRRGTYYVQYLVAAGADRHRPASCASTCIPEGDDRSAARRRARRRAAAERRRGARQRADERLRPVAAASSSSSPSPSSRTPASRSPCSTTRRCASATRARSRSRCASRYRISNGSQSAEGEVIVIPMPAPAQLRPPVANDDQVVVRAGDVVTIPVLDNDYHPNGDTIHVAPDLVPPLTDPEDGEIFVSQDTVRFRARPTSPAPSTPTYEAVDSTGQKDAGYITIQVIPVNAETNAAPRPRDLTARVLAGSRCDIAVPLDGIDDDGDSVELVGIASSPGKGRVVEIGVGLPRLRGVRRHRAAWTPSRTACATGSAPRPPRRSASASRRREGVNQAPYAVKDSVVMRPGRSVAVPVLANDSDPDGDEFGIVKNGLILPDVAGLEAKVAGQPRRRDVARRAGRDVAALHDPRRARCRGEGRAADHRRRRRAAAEADRARRLRPRRRCRRGRRRPRGARQRRGSRRHGRRPRADRGRRRRRACSRTARCGSRSTTPTAS